MLRNRNLAHTLTAMLGEIWINHCKPHTEVQTRPRFSVAFSTLTTCANSRVPPCSAGPLAVLGVDAGPRRMAALKRLPAADAPDAARGHLPFPERSQPPFLSWPLSPFFSSPFLSEAKANARPLSQQFCFISEILATAGTTPSRSLNSFRTLTPKGILPVPGIPEPLAGKHACPPHHKY